MKKKMSNYAEKTIALGTREGSIEGKSDCAAKFEVPQNKGSVYAEISYPQTSLVANTAQSIKSCIAGFPADQVCQDRSKIALPALQSTVLQRNGFNLEQQAELTKKFGKNFTLPTKEQYENEKPIVLYALWLRNQVDLEFRLSDKSLPVFGLLPMRRSEYVMTQDSAMPLFQHQFLYTCEKPLTGNGRLISYTALIYSIVQRVALDQSLGRNSAADPFCLAVLNLGTDSRRYVEERQLLTPSMPIPHHKYDSQDISQHFRTVDLLLVPDFGKRLDDREVSLPAKIQAEEYFKQNITAENQSEKMIGYTLLSENIGRKYTPSGDLVIRDRLQIQRIINMILVLFSYQSNNPKT